MNGQAVWISEEECKGPEVGACVACIKYCKEAPMSREGRVIRHGVREVTRGPDRVGPWL